MFVNSGFDDASAIVIQSIVFDITEYDTTTAIRQIGLPEFVNDFRKLILKSETCCDPPVLWERQEGDSHYFTLNSSWFDKSKDPKTCQLMTAAFKYMTEAGWALIKTSQWGNSRQFTLYFQYDLFLPKMPIDPCDMFVVRFQAFNNRSEITVTGASNQAQQCVRDAVTTR
ncbi:hypothetical protein EMPS_06898 [Entomortierella parvispora]|uniref:Uncharacterized protein n=1 Tax=Entomortierella parvispora TaxID=205924 RepID=A0A9P3HDH9_9FUNG|nr:hypothetical protein EMPS_06898 [Entomortierella parvispora]